MKMKRFAGMVAAVLVAASCVLPIAATKTAGQIEGAPTLSLGYNGKTQNASRNTFRWNDGRDAVTAVGQSPLAEGRELPVFIRVKGIDTVGLSFSYKPKSVTVNRWNATERGKLTAPPVAETLTDGMITLPSDDQSYIYEVYAQWKEGDARFAFEVAARETEGTSAIDRLPKDYSPATAEAAADLVLYNGEARNVGRLTSFAAKLDAKLPATLRIAAFQDRTTVTLYDLRYDGARLRCVTDSTRDGSDNGQISVATYDGFLMEDRTDGAGNDLTTAIGLRVGSGSRAIGSFVRPSIFIRAVPASMVDDNVSVGVDIVNRTAGTTLSYDMAFTLDRLTDEGWQSLSLSGSVAKVSGILQPGETTSERLPLSRVATPVTAGVYRVGKELVYDGGSNIVYTEFEVLEQQLPLVLGNPQSIDLVIGNGKSMTEAKLTRQGKYGTNSPLVYTMSEFEKLVPLPRDARLSFGAEIARAEITLLYADGTSARLTLTPGVTMTIGERRQIVTYLSHGGHDFVADSSLYDNLQKCAISIGGKPANH